MPRQTMADAINTIFQVMGLLYRMIPYVMPVSAADKVKPGKNAPLGKITIPKTSPIA